VGVTKPSDQIRKAIETSGMTRYQISKITGIAQSTLSRFMAGHAMSTDVLDALSPVLRLSIVVNSSRDKTGKRRARKRSTRQK